MYEKNVKINERAPALPRTPDNEPRTKDSGLPFNSLFTAKALAGK
jgi:hypothetical protein